jgi:hypothetical protein
MKNKEVNMFYVLTSAFRVRHSLFSVPFFFLMRLITKPGFTKTWCAIKNGASQKSLPAGRQAQGARRILKILKPDIFNKNYTLIWPTY